MSNINDKWSDYILRLDRESRKYTYGSQYNHFWNEVYEIKAGADKTSRGERIKINDLTEDTIEFTFYDEKTPQEGISATISLAEPRLCLRGESAQGGSNEYAWSRSDYVIRMLEKVFQNHKM